jgi:regulation of enolase protein 1 (concanavalin A-like superfamily)
MKSMFARSARPTKEPNQVRHCCQARLKGFAVIAFFLGAAAVSAQTHLELEGLPESLTWRNSPKASHIEGGKVLSISSGSKTDWFVDPFDETVAKTAPILSFTPGNTYVLSTKVQVQFSSKWDAGALMLWADQHHWAKLSFELSPEKQPTMVTVVTRGVSDDCNSVSVSGDSVYLQIARTGSTYVFYYATDGEHWRILRTFRLDTQGPVSVGFEAQSPDGSGTTAIFSDVHYSPKKISNVYTGK